MRIQMRWQVLDSTSEGGWFTCSKLLQKQDVPLRNPKISRINFMKLDHIQSKKRICLFNKDKHISPKEWRDGESSRNNSSIYEWDSHSHHLMFKKFGPIECDASLPHEGELRVTTDNNRATLARIWITGTECEQQEWTSSMLPLLAGGICPLSPRWS
ncbi:hypothetical protein Tco_0934059 [Tanacetum coccineum]